MDKREEKFNERDTNSWCERKAEWEIPSVFLEHSSTQKLRISVKDIRFLEFSGRQRIGKPTLYSQSYVSLGSQSPWKK